MINTTKLIVDTDCNVDYMLMDYIDGTFTDFTKHELVPGAIYVFGRMQYKNNRDAIRELIEKNQIKVVLSNSAEGSATLEFHCRTVFENIDLVKNKQVLLIAGGAMDPAYPHLVYDAMFKNPLSISANDLAESYTPYIYSKQDKPYKFLFLNGRAKAHRKYLIERFDLSGLLDQSIWSSLESGPGPRAWLTLMHNGHDILHNPRPIKTLDTNYEINSDNQYERIFGIKAEPYVDTYFSLVTETVFNYPHSFRTEKTSKPILIGHPFIVAANAGYYRDLRNLGFKTFGHLIDESFDTIESPQSRIERIAQVVEDLCSQDLNSFIAAAEDVCKYNQQHLRELSIKFDAEFPDRFLSFLKQYNYYE